MPAIKGQRPRRGVETEVLFARISPEHHKQVKETTEALGIGIGEYLDHLLAREAKQLDQERRPRWWKKPVPKDQQELTLSDGREALSKTA